REEKNARSRVSLSSVIPAQPASQSSAMMRSFASGSHSNSMENMLYGGDSPMKLQGIFPPIATPFDHEGNIYASQARHNIEKWNRTTLAGYVVCGSTGESVMLTTEEKTQLWGLVAQYAATDKLLIAGTGVESVRETVCLTNRAAAMGYKAAM